MNNIRNIPFPSYFNCNISTVDFTDYLNVQGDYKLLSNVPWNYKYSNIFTYSNVGVNNWNPLYSLDIMNELNCKKVFINESNIIDYYNSNLNFDIYNIETSGYFSNNYYLYNNDGIIYFPKSTTCSLLLVGAGGRGGGLNSSNIISDNASNIIISKNSKYFINNENIIDIDDGVYNIIFNSGSIIINNVNDSKYKLLYNSNNQIINPIAWYKFDNPINIGLDTQGNYNLYNSNSVQTSINSIFGSSCAYFSGSNQYLFTSNNLGLNNTNFTISFWLNRFKNNIKGIVSTISNGQEFNVLGSSNEYYAIFTNGYGSISFDRDTIISFVVIGGGGGGGGTAINSRGAGGGGAGQYINQSNITIKANTIINIKIGSGGKGGIGSANGANGDSSILSIVGEITYTANGGGGGARGQSGTNVNGLNGASGGGGSGGTTIGGLTINDGITGYIGGIGNLTKYTAGGGGGFMSQGSSGDATNGGNGGIGIILNITGENIQVCGGGGGGSLNDTTYNTPPGSGNFGGGNGGGFTGRIIGTAYDGFSATSYGSGGGGATSGDAGTTAKNGGDGYNGVVIIRYTSIYNNLLSNNDSTSVIQIGNNETYGGKLVIYNTTDNYMNFGLYGNDNKTVMSYPNDINNWIHWAFSYNYLNKTIQIYRNGSSIYYNKTIGGNGGSWIYSTSGGTVSALTYIDGTSDAYIIITAGTTLTLNNTTTVDILVIGGGGGGASRDGGGGGAGALIYKTNYSLSSGTYTITIGAGGAGATGLFNNGSGYPSNYGGATGGDTTIVSGSTTIFRAKGGGGGAFPNVGTGGVGGCNGGNAANTTAAQPAISALNIPQDADVFGNKGGVSATSSPNPYATPGGGGAGGVGLSQTMSGSTITKAGDGGIGKQISITGTNTYYAGGGGGGCFGDNSITIPAGTGGLGGGGNGSRTGKGTKAGNGTPNTGSGGGGGGCGPLPRTGGNDDNGEGGDGGSGVVIIRFKNYSTLITPTTGINFNDYFMIGSNNQLNINSFNGLIDDLRIYKTELSLENIKELYNISTYYTITDKNYLSIDHINPIAWYKFDSNNNIGLDTQGNYNLNNSNYIQTSINSIFGNSGAYFNGFNQYLFTPNNLGLNNTNFTISFWAYRLNSNVNESILQIGYDSNAGKRLIIHYNSNNYMNFALENCNNTYLNTTSNISLETYIKPTAIINYSNLYTLNKNNLNLLFNDGKIELQELPLKPLYSYPELTTTPHIWYKFDDSNNIGIDNMGYCNINNYDATFSSNDYMFGTGSVKFNGINQYLTNSNDFAFYVNNNINYSISYWCKNTNNNSFNYHFTIGSGNTNFIRAGYNTNNKIVIRTAFNTYDNLSDISYFDANIWVHLCFTYNAITNTVTIYRNGVNISISNNIMTPPSYPIDNVLKIGHHYNGSLNFYYNGIIDDFRIYKNYVLNPNEVKYLYSGSYIDTSYPILKINPTAWYKFDNSNIGFDNYNNYSLYNSNDNVTINNTDFVRGNSSALFNGTNNYLTNTNFININSVDFSVSVWVKRTIINATQSVLDFGTEASSYKICQCGFRNNNSIYFNFWNNDYQTSTTYADDIHKWVHLTFTYQTSNRNRKIYRNGVLVGNNTASGDLNTRSTINIGRSVAGSGSGSAHFGGLIDDLRIYRNYVLSPDEIYELYKGRIQIIDANENKSLTFNDDSYKWIHWAFGYNYLNKTVQIYRNGLSVYYNKATNNPINFDNYFIIGSNNQSGINPFNGLIDDFKIYNKELSPSQIIKLYTTSYPLLNERNSYPILKDTNNNDILPITWYKFDNDSTNMLLDSIGINHLTNINSIYDSSIFVNGIGSVLINNSSSYLTTVLNYNITNTNFTISFWSYRTYTNDVYTTFLQIGTNNYISIAINSAGQILFRYINKYTYSQNTYSYINKWLHITVTFNINSFNTNLYINGIKDTFINQIDTLPITDNNILRIGNSFIGNIDDLRIYNQELSAEQVQYLYFPSSKFTIKKSVSSTIKNHNTYSSYFINKDNSYPILKDIYPIAWYKFDNNNIPGYDDGINNNYNLSNVNSVIIDSSVFVKGKSSSLYSTSNYLELMNNFYNLNSNNFTISLWVNSLINNTNNYFITYGTTIGSNNILTIGYNSSNNILFGFYNDDLITPSIYPGDLNIWTHLGFTYNYLTKKQSIYKNGNLIASRIANNQLNSIDCSLRIGRFAKCYLDDLRIYNQELTINQINEIYRGKITIVSPILDNFGGGSAGEVVYYSNYNFNEGNYNIKIGKDNSVPVLRNTYINDIIAKGGEDGEPTYNTIDESITSIYSKTFKFGSYYSINNNNYTYIAPGTYDFIFNNGSLVINNVYDTSYPILFDINENIINPILWYKFNNMSNFLNDEINSSNNLWNNNCTFDTTNYIKGTGSIKFTAYSSQYVKIPNNLNLNLINITTGISFSLWVYITSLSNTTARIFDFGMVNPANLANIYSTIQISVSSNLIYFTIINAGTSNYFQLQRTIEPYNKWFHIVWTITTSGVWNIYLDGELILINSTRIVIPAFTLQYQYYFLGRGLTSANPYFDGNIDDFRIYDKILSFEQVTKLYRGEIKTLSLESNIVLNNTNISSGYTKNSPLTLVSYYVNATYSPIQRSKDYCLIFNNNGSFILNTYCECDIFMIGGGGGGGYNHGGGGGAGAYYYGTCNLIPGTYDIIVGSGGAGGTSSSTIGVNGGNTTIFLNNSIFLSVNGGGGGGGYSNFAGSDGGCGGGGPGVTSESDTLTNILKIRAGGLSSNLQTNGFGYNGGSGMDYKTCNILSGGGGGGIGSSGYDGISTAGGNGGDGLLIDITGNYVAYGGGGGGGTWLDKSATVGAGGRVYGITIGGRGGTPNGSTGLTGSINTGSGGGGGASGGGNGGAGGSGVVIIKIKQSKYLSNYTNNTINNYNYISLPITWYKFNNNLNEMLLDSIGNNHLINNNVIYDTYEFIRGNGSVYFDGTSAYLSCTLNYSLNNSDFSISFWSYRINIKNVQATFFHIGATATGTRTYITCLRNASNQIIFYIGSTYYKIVESSAYLNEWIHITITFNNTTFLTTLYINGKFKTSFIAAGVLAIITNQLTIGATNTFTNDFNGYIDDFRIYNKELSEKEIIYIYSSTITINSNCLIKFNNDKEQFLINDTYNIINSNGNFAIGTFIPTIDVSYPILANLNPIIWYKFENSNNYLNDYLNNADNTLINYNSIFSSNNYIKGTGSIYFNSSLFSHVIIPNNINFNYINKNKGISFSFWAKLNSTTPNSGRIIDFGQIYKTNLTIPSNYISIQRYLNQGSLRFVIVRSPINRDYGNLNNPYAISEIILQNFDYFDNNWRHIVWSISSLGEWNIYINGLNVYNASDQNIIPYFNSTYFQYNYIGRSYLNNGCNLDGNLDDFRIYDVVLSSNQVTELYNGNIKIINTNANNSYLNNYNYNYEITSNVSNLKIPYDSYLAFNYDNIIKIPSDNYTINFNNGKININNIYSNNSYPILKNNELTTIQPAIWYKFDDNQNLGFDSSSNTIHLSNVGNTITSNDFIYGNYAIKFNGNNYLIYDKNINNSNGYVSYNKNYSYVIYTSNGTINFNEDTICDIIAVGAGGRGGGYKNSEFIYSNTTSNIVINKQAIFNFNYNNFEIDKSYPKLFNNSNLEIIPDLFYKFDDSTNIGLSDNNNYNLFNSNVVSFSTNSVKGQYSGSFNGTNQYLVNPNSINLTNRSFSISFWSYRTNTTNIYKVFFKFGSSTSGTRNSIYLSRNSFNIISYQNNTINIDSPTLNSDINTWIHLAITYNNLNNQVNLYRNGINIGNGSSGGSHTVDSYFSLGSLATASYFQGLMDDFRVYADIVLTSNQILNLYNLSYLNLNVGSYDCIFNTGSIIFNNITDKSYPKLFNNSNLEIIPDLFYKFDNSTNIGLSDNNNYNLFNSNVVSFSTNAVKGQYSGSFNGTNQYLVNPNSINLTNRSFSISFWSYRTNTNDIYKVFFKFGSSTSGTRNSIYLSRNSFNIISYQNNTINIDSPTLNSDINTWIHLAITYNNLNNQVNLYRNGINIGNGSSGGSHTVDSYFSLGSLATASYFQGLIDDFRVYADIVLTSNQILELYNGRLIIKYPNINSYGGGGGGGEIIKYSQYKFNKGNYNINIGFDNYYSSNRITTITSNINIITADGGGDGAIYSIERKYPPKIYDSVSSIFLTTFNSLNCYRKDIYINSINAKYGFGTYEIYYSSIQNISLNNNIAAFFENNQYDNFGNFLYTSNITLDNYYGNWIVIKLPVAIILKSYTFYFNMRALGGGNGGSRIYSTSGGTVSALTYIDGTSDAYIIITAGTTLTLNNTTTVDILVIGGGGGGASRDGGGGGAGALIYKTNYSLSSGTYTITIGAGGAGATGLFNNGSGYPHNYGGATGGDTTIVSGASTIFRAKGGGGGAFPNVGTGGVGGCNGGNAAASTTAQPAISSANIPQDADVFGNKGGVSATSSPNPYATPGGGGAGGVGLSQTMSGSTITKAGDGGIGKQISITGTNTYYAGGGGGGCYGDNSITTPVGTGGLGGGGNGSRTGKGTKAGNGTPNTGSGGGGGGCGPLPRTGGNDDNGEGGDGGSGVVIIRFKNVNINAAPKTYRIYGSINGINWNIIDDIIDLTYEYYFDNYLNYTRFLHTNLTKYQYYCLAVNKTIGSTQFILNDLELKGIEEISSIQTLNGGYSGYNLQSNQRRYPPLKLQGITENTETLTTLNDKLCYGANILLNSNITYGSGIYEIRYNNIKNVSLSCNTSPLNLFNYNDVVFTNGIKTFINDNSYYIQFSNNGTIYIPPSIKLCDILVVGAGGRGGTGAFSGGGGAGEVIFYPSLLLTSGTYNINIGIDSLNSNNRVSKLTSNNINIITAKGGGDGSYSNVNLDIVRRYPSKAYDSSSVTIESTVLNGRNCFKQNIVLNNTNITYGIGTYEVYYSSYSSYTKPIALFNYTLPDSSESAHWNTNQYNNSTGVYKQTNYLVESNYLGDWVCIKMPIPIAITSYSFYQRTGGYALTARSPKNFKLYASVDGVTWVTLQTITNATYTNFIYTNTSLSNNTTLYTYYAIVVNQMSAQEHVLNFNEWVINGRQVYVPASSGGSGGGSFANYTSQTGAFKGTPFNVTYSLLNDGFTGTIEQGGNGGSALITGRYNEPISGLSMGGGGTGATSSSVPTVKSNYGDGGDGNGGLGYQGIVIFKFLVNNKSSFGSNNYNLITGYYDPLVTSPSSYLFESYYKGNWISIKLPKPIILTQYNIYPFIDSLNLAPKNFKIYGSNSGINSWSIIDYINQSSSNNYNPYFTKTLTNNITYFDNYCLTVNQIFEGSIELIIKEWVLYGIEDFNTSYIGTTLNGTDGFSEIDNIESITGNNLIFSLGGTGGTIDSLPIDKINTNFGYGGDGNGGIGTNGIVIIKTPNPNPNIFIPTNFTISLWIKLIYNNDNKVIFTTKNYKNNNVGYAINVNNYDLEFISSLTTFQIKSNFITSTPIWQHLLFTYSSSTKILGCYINGININSSGYLIDTINNFTTDNFMIKLGSGQINGDNIYNLPDGSLIDDFRIYDFILNDNQIQEIFNGKVNIYYNNLGKNKGYDGKSNETNIFNLTIGEAGIGGSSNSSPLIKYNYGSGGDGNNGKAGNGLVVIKINDTNDEPIEFKGCVNWENVYDISTNNLISITPSKELKLNYNSNIFYLDETNKLNISNFTSDNANIIYNGSLQITNPIYNMSNLFSNIPVKQYNNNISIGIGITNPQSKLHIGYNYYSNSDILIKFTDGSTGHSIDNGVTLEKDVTEAGILWNHQKRNTIFYTSNTERMRIDGNGNIGIGKTNPQSLLDINGYISVKRYDYIRSTSLKPTTANNYAVCFTTLVSNNNLSPNLITYTTNTTIGDSFTINQKGVYTINAILGNTVFTSFWIDKNSGSTVNNTSANPNILSWITKGNYNHTSIQYTGLLNKNDVIRIKCIDINTLIGSVNHNLTITLISGII